MRFRFYKCDLRNDYEETEMGEPIVIEQPTYTLNFYRFVERTDRKSYDTEEEFLADMRLVTFRNVGDSQGYVDKVTIYYQLGSSPIKLHETTLEDVGNGVTWKSIGNIYMFIRNKQGRFSNDNFAKQCKYI